jgi:Concanavalin A-like lectin/glucanases superfamily
MVPTVSFTFNPPTDLTDTSIDSTHVSLSWGPSTHIDASSTSLLLHLDSSFADSSINNIMFTGGTIDNTNFKFGGGSAVFAAAGDCSTPITPGGPLDLTTGDFTIEGWVFYTTASVQQIFLSAWSFGAPTTGGWRIYSATTGLQLQAQGSGGGTGAFSSSVNLITNAWNHFAAVRSGNSLNVFINGVIGDDPGSVLSPFDLGPVAPVLYMGRSDNSGIQNTWLVGNLDEIRITKAALYTASFTPPSAPFVGPTDPPPAYTIYRDGIELNQVLGGGVVTYTDYSVSPSETHVYEVAAQDGADDLLSDFSNTLTVTIPLSQGNAYGKFAAALTYPPFVLANIKGIRPRVYMPLEDITVRIKQ